MPCCTAHRSQTKDKPHYIDLTSTDAILLTTPLLLAADSARDGSEG